MKRFPDTRKAILKDAVFYGLCLYVMTTVLPFKDSAFEMYGGRVAFIVWSCGTYALLLLTLKIYKDWRDARR